MGLAAGLAVDGPADRNWMVNKTISRSVISTPTNKLGSKRAILPSRSYDESA